MRLQLDMFNVMRENQTRLFEEPKVSGSDTFREFLFSTAFVFYANHAAPGVHNRSPKIWGFKGGTEPLHILSVVETGSHLSCLPPPTLPQCACQPYLGGVDVVTQHSRNRHRLLMCHMPVAPTCRGERYDGRDYCHSRGDRDL
jgi:hypothetical protein